MTKQDIHIAQLQDLCGRTLAILEDENFFEKTADSGGYQYTSLFTDLTKAREGKELKTFNLMYSRCIDVIKELEDKK